MDKEQFLKNFGNNLKKNIDENFKTQKEFAEFFDELTVNVSRWCKGNALPDLYKIYKICESMGITVDYLIKGEPSNLSGTSIDYNLFDEIVNLTNQYAKDNKIKVGGKQYLSVYEAVANFKRINHKTPAKDIFELLKPTLETWK